VFVECGASGLKIALSKRLKPNRERIRLYLSWALTDISVRLDSTLADAASVSAGR
jgi:hypothetical protein